MTTLAKTPEKINHKIKLLIQIFASQFIPSDRRNVSEIKLYGEAIRFVEKLADEINYDLTLEDVRLCLEALETYFENGETANLKSPEQQSLLQIWIDKLTLFN